MAEKPMNSDIHRDLIHDVHRLTAAEGFADLPSRIAERLHGRLSKQARVAAARARARPQEPVRTQVSRRVESSGALPKRTRALVSLANNNGFDVSRARILTDHFRLTRPWYPTKPPPQPAGGPSGPPTALVLGGGGSKGSFEVGALAFLAKRWNENQVNYVCGTSVGALNALALSALGVAGVTTLMQIYTSLRAPSSMYEYTWRLQNVNTLLRVGFGTSLTTVLGGSGSSIDPDDLLFYDQWWVRAGTYLVPVIGQLVAAFILWEVTDTIENKLLYLQTITQILGDAESIYTLDPVRQLIIARVPLKLPARIPLRMAMVSLETGQVHYMNEDGNLLIGGAAPSAPGYEGTWSLEGSREQNLIDGAIASASIPGAFAAQQLRVDPWTLAHFVDGGVREMLPMAAAKELGVERIIAIIASPLDVERKVISQTPPKMPTTVGRSLDILTNEIAVDEYAPSNGWCDDLDRILVYPQFVVHETLIVDPGLIRINMAYGYMSAYDMYLGQTGQLTNLSAWQFLLAYVATWAAIELRMEAHALEERLFNGNNPDLVVFDKPKVDSLRRLKAEILDMTVARFVLMGEDPDSLPLQLQADGGSTLSIHDWWKTWERHYAAYEQVFSTFDLWSPLPIGRDSGGNRIFENPADVPPRPTTTLF